MIRTSIQNSVRRLGSASLSKSAVQPSISIRSIHQLPKLARGQEYKESGIPGIYSKEGFSNVWTEYQQYLVDELSRQTAETEHETRTPFGIMLNTAPNQLDASTFSYASQAHNNHLFIESLKPESFASQTRPSPRLLEAIERDFNSFEELKNEFFNVGTSPSNLGAGWLFLIEGASKKFYLKYLFQAGSPYFTGRFQPFDFNIPIDQAHQESLVDIKSHVDGKVHLYNMPLLAVNCWEIAYLKDYTAAGRNQYLEKVWNCLDWDVISSRYFGN